jgi:hypothetical protein
MAIASPLNLRQITTGVRSLGVAVTRAQVSANRSAGILVNRNKIKRKLVFGDRLSFDRRRERVRRRRQEDIIESSTIGGFIKNRGLALANTARGFLGRIMDFLGTLLVGWLLNNLPTIISMAQELMARMGRLVNILGGFVNNIGKSLQSFGGVLGAVAVTFFTPILPYALAFAAGAMIFVVVEEVIPETQQANNTDIATLGFIGGFVVMMTLDVALG